MATRKRIRFHKFRFRKLKKAPPGSAPGLFTISEDAIATEIRVYSYNAEELITSIFTSVDQIKKFIDASVNMTHWIEIKGFGNRQIFEDLSVIFNIHKLEIEDVLSGHQRPKVEESEDHLFVVSRGVYLTNEVDVADEQLSIFVFNNFVISIQENISDHFLLLKERLEHNRGVLRKSGSSYLAYALMDSIVDNYFPFLETMGTFLDDLEDKLLYHPEPELLQHIQATKRRLIFFRKIAWSEREKLNEILRTPSPLFSDVARRYLRDTYDHTIQVMDVIDSYREITASLMDIYLSSVSNRLNQIMKFLTIISTVFIPLTFITGLYGMNFVFKNADTGQENPLNMPELRAPYGYVIVIGVMLLIVLAQLYYFYRKGWLKVEDKD